MLSKNLYSKMCSLVPIVLLLCSVTVNGQSLFSDNTFKTGIPSPESELGFKAGDRPVRHAEALQYYRLLSEKSTMVRLFNSGKTHEGRELIYIMISSEENISNLETIRENLAILGDPRKPSTNKSRQQLIQSTPAIAWMMYSIHGDELSGADAALQLAYHLVAATDSATQKLVDNLVIAIDPFENPDGRERYLAQMEQWRGTIPSSDVQSIQHRGVWPWGRTNHYLFDLNRDWIIVSQPETRARVQAINHWNPQMVIDAHEMGSYSSFLFNPPREPINPHVKPVIRKWWDIFAADQASAFDQHGWSYYTKEWLEDWYPGYGSAWPCFRGAIGILYEQASYDGSLVKKPGGVIATYRDAVQRQLISSFANLTTLADNRQQILNDYERHRRQATQQKYKNSAGMYFFEAGKNPSRLNRFLERLIAQGIEIERLDRDIRISQVKDYRNGTKGSHTFRVGDYAIRALQPLQPLIHAILEPDPRMISEFLKSERESLEKGKGTRLYEISGWSLPYAFDLQAYSSVAIPDIQSTPVAGLSKPNLQPIDYTPNFGFLLPYNDDSVIDALILLFQKGYNIRSARKPFSVEGRSYDRGTLLIRINENPQEVTDDINTIIASTLAEVVPVNTALSQDGPDLGGDEFRLLSKPKAALLTGPGISSYNFGALWYLLDFELKLPVTVLNQNRFSRTDLRKYNVLILPAGGRYKSIFQKDDLKKLKQWVQDGGTLIAIGSACTFLADSSIALSKVKLKRNVLEDLESYQRAYQKELAARNVRIDSAAIWSGTATPANDNNPETATKMSLALKKENDTFQRMFMPRGAIMRIDLDPEHWLNYGMSTVVPALVYSSYAYLAKKPVQVAGRFSDTKNIRFSGLLWPEARARWATTVFHARESKGNGQVIVITNEPNFRSYFYGTAHLFINAVLLGPGLGARQYVPF